MPVQMKSSFFISLRILYAQLAAVDLHHAACHIGSLIRGQKRHHTADFLRLCNAPERDLRTNALRFCRKDVFVNFRIGHAGHISQDSNAFRSQFAAGNFGEICYSHLGHYLGTALVQIYTTEEDLHPHTLNAQFIDMTGFSAVTKEIIYYIETHFKSQFTLDDMGKALGYHKSHLCMKFKQDTQSTINDYLNLVRIFRFTEYYTFLDEEIAFICKHCGFTSASHFNKTYKKFLGMAPRNYARMRGPHFNSAVFENDLREHTENIQPLQSILARMDGPSRMDIQKVSPKVDSQVKCSKD